MIYKFGNEEMLKSFFKIFESRRTPLIIVQKSRKRGSHKTLVPPNNIEEKYRSHYLKLICSPSKALLILHLPLTHSVEIVN